MTAPPWPPQNCQIACTMHFEMHSQAHIAPRGIYEPKISLYLDFDATGELGGVILQLDTSCSVHRLQG